MDEIKSLLKQPVSWLILEDHIFQRLNVTHGCPVSDDALAGFTSVSDPDFLTEQPADEVVPPPDLGSYAPKVLKELGLENFDDCHLTMWRGRVRHQLKGGNANSHHHEVWRLVLIRNKKTGEGHLWPVDRDTDVTDLQSLNLDMVKCTEISKNVVWLDISDQNLKHLPDAIGSMRHLRKLECYCNLLTELPDSLCGGGPGGSGSPPPLEYLALNENKLTTVTPLLVNLTKLRWLSLNGNRLDHIPALPPNVERLSLHCNHIESLPDELGCQGALRAVSLHANRIKTVPPSFLAGLKACNTFSIMRNQIEVIPDTLCEMEALNDLWLYSNPITELPRDFGKLHNLKRFWVDSTAITELPSSIGGCEKLEQLYASNNRITSLPPSLLECKFLGRISLDGNPQELLESIPEELKSKLVSGANGMPVSSAPTPSAAAPSPALSSLNWKEAPSPNEAQENKAATMYEDGYAVMTEDVEFESDQAEAKSVPQKASAGCLSCFKSHAEL